MQRVPRSRVSREARCMPSERVCTLQTNRLTTRSNLANLCGGASDAHPENSATKHSSRPVDLQSAITVLVVARACKCHASHRHRWEDARLWNEIQPIGRDLPRFPVLHAARGAVATPSVHGYPAPVTKQLSATTAPAVAPALCRSPPSRRAASPLHRRIDRLDSARKPS